MDAAGVMERACAEHPELRLPDDLRALLERAGGIDGGPLETIDFTGATFDVEIRDLFPSGLPIAHDGSGNHWILDLTPHAAPPLVFFASHDPPGILVHG